MSLLNRQPVRIGRAQRKQRDDRVFVIATEDTYAPKQYFELLRLPRVKIVVLETPLDSGLSAPTHVVQRLKDAFSDVKRRKEVQTGDEFWVLIDTDHYFQGANLKSTLEALRKARHAGLEVAISNPCFELWLLLHHQDVGSQTVFGSASSVGIAIKKCIGEYNKRSIKPGQFPLEKVELAIRRAQEMSKGQEKRWPQRTGTQMHLLMEKIIPRP